MFCADGRLSSAGELAPTSNATQSTQEGVPETSGLRGHGATSLAQLWFGHFVHGSCHEGIALFQLLASHQ